MAAKAARHVVASSTCGSCWTSCSSGMEGWFPAQAPEKLMNDPQVREAPEPSVEVEPIADEEVVGNGEADVAERDVVDEPSIGSVQERAGRDLARPAQASVLIR